MGCLLTPKKTGGMLSLCCDTETIWVFPKIGVGPQNGWFITENPNKIHDLGGPPLFLETPILVKPAFNKDFFETTILWSHRFKPSSGCLPRNHKGKLTEI